MSARKSSAFVPHDLAQPLAGAPEGPLAGLTAAVKDMYDIAGERAGGGSPEWLAAQPPAAANAGAVRRLLEAGVTVVGKTVCDEFFFSVTGANAHYGTPVNPRAPGRLPGGSSSGSAVAVAAGACDLALGSDTGGSVRVPAALNGIYGIRPTHGRMDATGVMAMAPSFDTPGWFAAGPGLLRRLGPILLDGPAERVPVRHAVLAADAMAQADPPVAALLRGFIDRAAGVVPESTEVVVAPDGFDAWRGAFRAVQGREIWAIYGDWMAAHRPNLGPGIRERLAFAATVGAEEVDSARAVMAEARARIRGLLSPGTVMLLPTVPCIAPPLDAPPGELDSFRSRVMALTCIAGLGGLPQVTIPAGLVAGCPVGLSLVGWAGGDEALLDLAVALAPWCGS